MYLTVLSRVVTKRKRHCQHLFPHASHRDKRHSNVDFHVFKKQTSESAICQSLNNLRMGFPVLYEMISNEPCPVGSETLGSEMKKKSNPKDKY